MRIWIDIGHPAQLNFYSNAIKKLSKDNNIIITIIDRGRLVKITNKEFGSIKNCEIIPVGRHLGTKFSAIIDANVLRLLKLFRFYFKYRPQIALGNSYLHGIIGKTFRIPAIMFGDDIGRKLVIFLMVTFSTEMYYVAGSLDKKKYKKISIYNALKEWAYLSPTYFKPSNDILTQYNLEEKNYIFVREVITGTLNYHSQNKNIIATISDKFPKGVKVLFSLEDKNTLCNYPEEWILLQEPINDIHSLIYYSKVLVSSGDSMAREGSMLGIPSIYCGIREMNANNVMINKGMLFHKQIEEVPGFIEEVFHDLKFNHKEEFRQKLKEEWEDVTELIVNKVNNYKK